MEFSKSKFLNLPYERQHKKCAELLRLLYMKVLNGEEIHFRLFDTYQTAAALLQLSPIMIKLETIANRYHLHMECANKKHKEHNLLPLVKKGDRDLASPLWPIAIYLDHLRSAHNVGSILRTVEGFSLGKIYFSEKTPFITNKQVQDASMGTWKWVSCSNTCSLSDLPKPSIALETCHHSTSLFEYTFPETFTLILGNEEYGCSEEALKSADAILEIPLRGRKNSLNVANAFAIVAAEISRQKNS